MLWSVFVVCLSSCNNDIDEIVEKSEKQEIIQNENATVETRAFCEQQRSSITTTTVYGYTSKSHSSTIKTTLSENFRNELGVPNKIYFLQTVTVYHKLNIKGLNDNLCFFTDEDSPNCGFAPGASNRGYAYSRSGDEVTLSTRLTYIISDISGIEYNLWHPCKPEELEWNYKLIYLD